MNHYLKLGIILILLNFFNLNFAEKNISNFKEMKVRAVYRTDYGEQKAMSREASLNLMLNDKREELVFSVAFKQSLSFKEVMPMDGRVKAGVLELISLAKKMTENDFINKNGTRIKYKKVGNPLLLKGYTLVIVKQWPSKDTPALILGFFKGTPPEDLADPSQKRPILAVILIGNHDISQFLDFLKKVYWTKK